MARSVALRRQAGHRPPRNRGQPMKSITRSLPLLLLLPAMHLHAQSISPAWDAYMKKQAAPATTTKAQPVTDPGQSQSQTTASDVVAPVAPPAPRPAPRAEPRNAGGFFVAVHGGKGWLYEDADQTAKAVSAGYRWDAGDFTLVGIELAGDWPRPATAISCIPKSVSTASVRPRA
ncbi:hypothetical protein [Xanthomonas sp. XNM01]|uniref:hypothetical protein n=1 Tax=Xanthomonas sp. XNM01 TaxID=2769289 RepID=UPI001782446B|nr:hypothetical protein [Xanthomonas sp. XNM01]